MARPTKYQQFEKQLLDRIQRGTYSREQVLPSEHQFSEEFGLSRGTVRKVLLHLKEQGTINSEAGKGYFISENVAPVLPSGKQIGFMHGVKFNDWNINHSGCLFYSRLEEKLLPHKKQLIHIPPQDIENEELFCQAIENFNGQALVVAADLCEKFQNKALLSEFLATTDKRVVLYTPEFPVLPPLADIVYNDWRHAVRETVKEQVKRGKQNIIYCGYGNVWWSELRKSAFLLTMRQEGLWEFGQAEPTVICPYDIEDQRKNRIIKQEDKTTEAFLKFYRQNPDIEAVICCNDNLIKTISRKLPLSELPTMIGFDNDHWAQQCQVSSIDSDIDSIATTILRLLATPKTNKITQYGVPALFYDREQQ